MCNNISLVQARKDLKYLMDNYGEIKDFCGGFCNTEMLQEIMLGNTSVKDAIIANIECYFSSGIDDTWGNGCTSSIMPDLEDKKVKKIIDRYGIEVPN